MTEIHTMTCRELLIFAASFSLSVATTFASSLAQSPRIEIGASAEPPAAAAPQHGLGAHTAAIPEGIFRRRRSSGATDRRLTTIALWSAIAGVVGFAVGFAVGRATTPTRSRLAQPAAAPRSPTADKPDAMEAFHRHHRDFRTLYAELWRAAEDKNELEDDRVITLANWHRSLELVGNKALLDAWQSLERSPGAVNTRAFAKAWLEALERWGLTPIKPGEIEITKESLLQFHVEPRRESGRAIVVEPCWTFAGVILQKGQAVPKS